MTDRRCPSCHAAFKRPKPFGVAMNESGRAVAVGPGGRPPRQPEPGDITMCTDCGAFALNLEGGLLRPLTADETARIAKDPRTVAALAARRRVEQQKQEQRN